MQEQCSLDSYSLQAALSDHVLPLLPLQELALVACTLQRLCCTVAPSDRAWQVSANRQLPALCFRLQAAGRAEVQQMMQRRTIAAAGGNTVSKSGLHVQASGGADRLAELAFSPDSQLLACWTDKHLKVCSADAGVCILIRLMKDACRLTVSAAVLTCSWTDGQLKRLAD